METTPPKIDSTQIAKALDMALEQADAHRSGSLGVATNLSTARSNAHALELERVTAKYGPDSPEAADMTTRTAIQGVVVATVAAEQQRANIAPPKIDAHSSAIIGRVIDASSNGIANYTVSALDDTDAVITYGCSDAKGAFQLTIPQTGDSTNVRLRVTDDQQRIRFSDAVPMSVAPQKWYYRELKIQDPMGTCAPPKDAAKPTTKKGKTPPGNPPTSAPPG